MIIRKIICDMCKSEIKEGEQKDLAFMDAMGNYNGLGEDLCPICVAKLMRIATGDITLELQPEEPEKEPETELDPEVEELFKKVTQKVDDDELREMFKAGSSTKQMQERFGVSAQTIYNHLQKMGLR